ncbi:RNA polymerase sigma-70 factor, ECF subfamily [Lutibacter oricola]|uniref:RNA polymerase sigma-70 factor, ECF subfamily n=1 Tax=Lutibacter oricola TaxID=762486 RepID=A0A1H3F4F3_9FLAO|nr:sigma-70 family RNA polymerase sigma factor [Lutibacter oricola]SDX85064.1 RNA polymerase sigma-70 factor, ECF subfamily [Lutibacter oricola]
MNKTVCINAKIVEGCRHNNAKAQMKLYDLYCEAMFIVAKRYVKDKVIAEDVMQDAFIKVFKNINSFKNEVTIGAWIKKIVINQCIDYLKKKRIELVSIEEKELKLADNDDWMVEDETTIEKVLQTINQLPEKYKTILNLYLIEGYDHQEISQILNITEVASRSQLMRGKNKLKNQFKDFKYV